MTSHQPSSVVGTWLLDRFCLDPAVAGDLMEEYRRGQTTLWYWREVVAAICAYSWSAIWEHKWLTVRAIATGWLFSFVVIRMGMHDIVHPRWDAVAPASLYPCAAYLAWALNGWFIGKLHRPYSTAMVSAYAIWLVFRNVSPIYAAATDALAGVDGSAFLWEFGSRVSSMLVVIAGGMLCAYRDQLAERRNRVAMTRSAA
ncbi:MAG TPA: hypothetical protein VG871_24035 [Vicinamibacterales bacterium]|nr:hypothetical protein [Vicinamibacterales bacterium]